MQTQLLLLELNEINFEFLDAYISRGDLQNFAALFRMHGFLRTTSETKYEHLEPWIQWVTAHTGRPFAEHSVFRLGDIVSRDIPQIWEILEEHGLKVGAISPMNAKHRVREPAFFVPDPWTPTQVSGPWTLRRLYDALSQAVNDNAASKVTVSSALHLLWGAARYARPVNYSKYAGYAVQSRAAPWRKAMFLDLLLSDVFVREVRRTKPHFSSLFLNAGAHIQHHYMFSAAPYRGPHRNPDWYIGRGLDPVFEVYALYDRILGQIQRSFPQARLMLATGLHQVPHEHATYYWRLKDHESFVRKIGIEFETVEPRMSRDFLIRCSTATKASVAESVLKSAVHEDGTTLFEVDNRGKDLFVMLTYPKEIVPNTRFAVGGHDCGGLYEHVVFVALKNGEHNGIGYFLDTGTTRAQQQEEEFPLADLPRRIATALGVDPRAGAFLSLSSTERSAVPG